jgi:Dyp-type peroxidase family
MIDRTLDFNDIQGNVLGGFNTDVQELLALTVLHSEDFPRAAKWLADQAPLITVVAQVRATRDLIKSQRADTGAPWLGLAVGQRLLKQTQPDLLIRDDAFNVGMSRRAPSVLGDKTDPAKWRVGGADSPVDVLLIVAANDEAAVKTRADALSESAAAAGLVTTYRETGRRLDDHEHFGFRDGISQPAIMGADPAGDLGPGYFVFGYSKQPGGDPFSPVVDPRGLSDNGSLLVFRRLRQDVRAFRKFCADEAARIGNQGWPGLTANHLAALLVGRWPSGAPVKAGQSTDPQTEPNNGFDFLDDPDARSCPFGAHIRKVNPRNGPKDVVDVPRILRRGIPFGPLFDNTPDDDNRGLLFLAFQTSVKLQFEFLAQHWMNSASNPASGNDLLVGRSDNARMTIIGPAGVPIEVSAPNLNWIEPTGGAYLFAPGRSGLAKFASPPAPVGFWKAKQIWAITSDALRASLFD